MPPDPGLIVGRNPVREALQRGDVPLEKVFLRTGVHGSPIDAIRQAARTAGVPVQVVPEGRLNALAPGTVHQGVVAIGAPVAYLDVDAMLSAVAPDLDAVRATRPLVLALDEITDPHNYGAILRSAVAAGVAGVVVPERNMAPLSATAVKASAGLALRIPIARAGNLAEALHGCKERGYWVVGLDGGLEGGLGDGAERPGLKAEAGRGPEQTTVWAYDWARPVVLVVGSEGRGLRPRVRAACDVLAAIPMPGPAESLNASVAAGVALFAAVRARAGAEAAPRGAA